MPTLAQLSALESAAASWLGTPFCANSAVKGAGVCCHLLVSEILIEAGWMPRVEVPFGNPRHGVVGSAHLMEEWFAAHPELFADVTAELLSPDSVLLPPSPGDVILCRPARLPHHLLLTLSGGRYIHAVFGGRVGVVPVIPAPWLRRLERIYRPLQLS